MKEGIRRECQTARAKVAHTREDCEEKLAEMIAEVKAKIAAEKAAMKR